MGADLHIHVLEASCTLADLAIFFESSIGSKYFAMEQTAWDSPKRKEAWEHVGNTPQQWIGEVSWLKAGLFGDVESYVPDPVMKVQELISDNEDEMAICTSELIDRLCEAVQVPVQAKANFYTTLKEQDELRKFLTPHIGKWLFTVSW